MTKMAKYTYTQNDRPTSLKDERQYTMLDRVAHNDRLSEWLSALYQTDIQGVIPHIR